MDKYLPFIFRYPLKSDQLQDNSGTLPTFATIFKIDPVTTTPANPITRLPQLLNAKELSTNAPPLSATSVNELVVTSLPATTTIEPTHEPALSTTTATTPTKLT